MKRKLFLMLTAVLLVLAAACSGNNAGQSGESGQAGEAGKSGDSARNGILVVNIPADVGTLDPGVSIDNAAWKITYPAYDRLVAYDGEKTTVKPSLAKE